MHVPAPPFKDNYGRSRHRMAVRDALAKRTRKLDLSEEETKLLTRAK